MAKKGTIYIRKDLGVGFIPIPKNGSSTIRGFFFDWDPMKSGDHFNFIESPDILKNIRVIAILSDPEIRFSRGITEVINRSESSTKIRTPEFNRCNNTECEVNSILNQIEDIGFYDAHIKPQIYFITDNKGYILESLEIWLLKDLTTKIREIDPRYNGKKEWSKGNMKNKYLDSIKGSNKLKCRLMSFYEKDYLLYNSIIQSQTKQ